MSVLKLHAVVTAILVIVTLIVLGMLILGQSRKSAYTPITRGLMWAFSGVSSLQWCIGLVVLISIGNFGSFAFWSHAGTMTAAVIVSYLPHRGGKSDAASRYRRALTVVIAVIVLVTIGLLLLLTGGHKKTS